MAETKNYKDRTIRYDPKPLWESGVVHTFDQNRKRQLRVSLVRHRRLVENSGKLVMCFPNINSIFTNSKMPLLFSTGAAGVVDTTDDCEYWVVMRDKTVRCLASSSAVREHIAKSSVTNPIVELLRQSFTKNQPLPLVTVPKDEAVTVAAWDGLAPDSLGRLDWNGVLSKTGLSLYELWVIVEEVEPPAGRSKAVAARHAGARLGGCTIPRKDSVQQLLTFCKHKVSWALIELRDRDALDGDGSQVAISRVQDQPCHHGVLSITWREGMLADKVDAKVRFKYDSGLLRGETRPLTLSRFPVK